MLTEAQVQGVVSFDPTAVRDAEAVFRQVSDSANSTAATQPIALGSEVVMSFLLPDAVTSTYKYTVPDKLEIIDVTVVKDGAGAGNTIQLLNGAGTAISDAIAAAVDKTVTHAGTLDKATRVLAAGAELRITNTKAAGSTAAAVFVKAIRRA